MNRKHAAILQDHALLLAKNIIPSDGFYRMLVTYDIFTDDEVQEIQNLPKKDRMGQLIEGMFKKKDETFGRLCDLLDVTGHHFLSESLREADNHDRLDNVSLADAYTKFPQLSKAFKTAAQKEEWDKYVREKVYKEVMRHTWRGDAVAKEQLIMARQKQIEQNWTFVAEAKVREKDLAELQADYLSLQQVHEDTKRELKSMHRHIEDLKRSHKEELQVQMNFNMASDRQITREHAKVSDGNECLATIRRGLEKVMGPEFEHFELKVPNETLIINFQKFVAQTKDLRELAAFLQEERAYIGTHLGIDKLEERQSLKEEFREYVLTKEDELATERANSQRLTEALARKDETIEECREKYKTLQEDRSRALELASTAEEQASAFNLEAKEAKAAMMLKEWKLASQVQINRSLKARVTELEKDLKEAQRQSAGANFLPSTAQAFLHNHGEQDRYHLHMTHQGHIAASMEKSSSSDSQTSEKQPPPAAVTPPDLVTPSNSTASLPSPMVTVSLGDGQPRRNSSPPTIGSTTFPFPHRYKPLKSIGKGKWRPTPDPPFFGGLSSSKNLSVPIQSVQGKALSPVGEQEGQRSRDTTLNTQEDIPNDGVMNGDTLNGDLKNDGALGGGPLNEDGTTSYDIADGQSRNRGSTFISGGRVANGVIPNPRHIYTYKVERGSMGNLRESNQFSVPYTQTPHSRKMGAAKSVKMRRL